MGKKITYAEVRRILAGLGYRARDLGNRQVVYRNPDRELMIVIPETTEESDVRPVDMLRVRKTLAHDGVIREDQFDSLFSIRRGDQLVWREPGVAEERRVTAASDESDGVVIIDQGGQLLSCTVDQLEKASSNHRADNPRQD
jgi:hypothetical protein